MQCPVCGTRIEKDWGFCPRCGTRISGDFFDEIFSRMRKELAEMNKLLEKDIEAFDLSPWFRDMDRKKTIPKGSGFTIKIVHSADRKPEVSVRTFGNVDKTKLRKEMGELGVWQPSLGNQSSGKSEFSHAPPKPKPPELVIKGPMKTEEPKTSVAKSASNVIVNIELPGVKAEGGNIEVSELENSVEVKALAKDKAYFKILTKPPQFRLARKSFEKGVLHLEFS
jgi:HSP20 family molecular chaperone IbpA